MKEETKSKDCIKGYENGRKMYHKMKGRYFNEKYIPEDIENRIDYGIGWYQGWDDAQREDITVNEQL